MTNEKEICKRIDEIKKRLGELMNDLKAVVKDFETLMHVKESASREAREAAAEGTKKSRKTDDLTRIFDKNLKFVRGELNRAYDFFMTGDWPKSRLEGKCDKLDFFAYLYLVAYKKGWFDADYKDRCKQTFSKFLRYDAFAHLGLNYSDRTFTYRLAGIEASCKHLLGKGVKPTEENCKDAHARNFRKIYFVIE